MLLLKVVPEVPLGGLDAPAPGGVKPGRSDTASGQGTPGLGRGPLVGAAACSPTGVTGPRG